MKIRKNMAWSVRYLVFFFALSVFFPAFSADPFWVDSPYKKPYDSEDEPITAGKFAKIAEKIRPAMVYVSSKISNAERRRKGAFPGRPGRQSPHSRRHPGQGQERFDWFGPEIFDWFFQGPGPDREPHEQISQGSGFIINKDGYVVTNHHVVQNATSVEVRLFDDSEYEAEIVGIDPKTDIALLKINAKTTFSHVTLGSSRSMEVGDFVMAMGNPFNIGMTLTKGIVSAKERNLGVGMYDSFIQTDASINQGNSGGPLVNLRGEVIGINTLIIAGGQGIGFAIPIDFAKPILTQLKDHGKVIRGQLGVFIQPVTKDHMKVWNLKNKKGALVSDVVKDSAAEKAGLKVGDIIVKLNDREIQRSTDLPLLVAHTNPGEKVSLVIIRDGQEKKIQAKLKQLESDDEEEVASMTAKNDRAGIEVQEISEDLREHFRLGKDVEGVIVTDVVQGKAAFKSGLRAGDLLLEINRHAIKTLADYEKMMKTLKDGDSIVFLVKRGENTLFLAFSL